VRKYFYKVTALNGQVLFNHSSDFAYRLVLQAAHKSRDRYGSAYPEWCLATVETNIPNDVIRRAFCGEKV